MLCWGVVDLSSRQQAAGEHWRGSVPGAFLPACVRTGCVVVAAMGGKGSGRGRSGGAGRTAAAGRTDRCVSLVSAAEGAGARSRIDASDYQNALIAN